MAESGVSQFHPLIGVAGRTDSVGADINDGSVALDTDKICLLLSGVLRWPEFIALSKIELEALISTQYASLKIRGVRTPAFGEVCDECGQTVE